MIDDFVEGVLSPDKELELFHTLSNNPELISDLKQLMALKMSIAEDILDHGPHPESINSITDQLGFNSNKPGIFTRYRQTFVTSAIAGVLFLLLQFNPFGDDILSNSENFASTSNTLNTTPDNYLASNNSSSSIVHDTVYIDREKLVFVESSDKEETIPDEKVLDENNGDYFSQGINTSIIETPFETSISSNSRINKPYLLNTYSRNNSNDNNHLIESSFNGFMNISEIKQVNRDYQNFNNFNLTYLYKLSDRYYIGMDYSRENFYQTFFTVENNQAMQYFQNPDFNTLSAIFRYYLDIQIFDNQEYYLQLDLGLPINENFNFAGLSNRLSMGIQHQITNSLYLKTNVNYSTLFFRQNNLIYDTSKFGFNVGAGFKL